MCFALPREKVRVRMRVQVKGWICWEEEEGKRMVRERIKRGECQLLMTAYLWGRNSLFHITFRYNKDVENSQGPYQLTLRLYHYRQWLSLVKYSHFIAIRVAFFINKQADMSFFHELYMTIFEITLVHISYYWQLPGVPSCINHLTHGLCPYLCDLGFTGLSINISGQNILLMVGTSSYKVNLHIESKAKKKEVSH